MVQGGVQGSMMLEAVANNPELLRSMIQANPIIQRLIERNPQFGEVFNNPQLLADSMRALGNPVCPFALGQVVLDPLPCTARWHQTFCAFCVQLT
jgi:hypothetical protein